MKSNQVVLIDSLNLAFRMHFANMHLATKKGVRTGVMYGMLKTIIDITKKVGPCDIIWFWEGGLGEGPPVRTWRKAFASDYKGNRKKNPDRAVIMEQASKVKEILQTLGYAQFYLPGIEADDLIGVVSNTLAHEHDTNVYILSTDRDFLQCVDDSVVVLRPGGGKLVAYTPKVMYREFSVQPEQWAAYKALVGDPSDHYKGVEGVGPAGALKMLSDGVDPSLKHFKDHAASVVEKHGDKLKDKWEDAYRCFQLSYIPRSVTFKHFTQDVRTDIKHQLKQLPEMRKRTIPRARYNDVLDQWTKFCSTYELSSFLSERRKFFATARIC